MLAHVSYSRSEADIVLVFHHSERRIFYLLLHFLVCRVRLTFLANVMLSVSIENL
jgi:hypothetical protein